MHRRAFVLTLAAASLAACVSHENPDDPGDACSMFEHQDGWWRAAKRAEDRWGAPPALQLAIIRQESGFHHNARPPRGRFLWIFPGARASSAHGYAQALRSTWEEYERDRGDAGADRNEFSDAADFVSWYTRKSRRQLGIPFENARDHYLAYHEGQGGYSRGSYQGNSTLMASADRVQSYRDTYQAQLDQCDGRLNRWWLPF